MTRWIDTHCHIQFDDYPKQSAFDNALQRDVEMMFIVGCDARTSQQAVDFAKSHRQHTRAIIGLHPHDAKNGLATTVEVLEKAMNDSRECIVGIGETGLDYFYEHSERATQRIAFAQQVQLAQKYQLTLVIHTRDAWDETFDILRSEGVPPRTVIHCFTGGIEESRKALDLGLSISFSGITTFKNAVNVQEAAVFCPTDRMLLETDSPFLAPIPFRGRPNEPANVGVVGEFISDLRNLDKDQFAADIYESTQRSFDL